MILPLEDYQDIIANPAWIYTVPAANPSEYPLAAVTAPVARREQIQAEWTRLEHNQSLKLKYLIPTYLDT